MLEFFGSESNKRLSDFARELLDADLELIQDADCDIETDYIELLFPEILWAEDKDRCVKRFYEFRARLADDFLHKTTELEWYMMMRLHYRWEEVYSDFRKQASTPKKKKDLQPTLDLLDQLGGCFDGDCEQVASLFALYKERSPLLVERFGYADLDSFMELMPRDILQEYLALKAKRNNPS